MSSNLPSKKIVFTEFTEQSLSKINEQIVNEKTGIEIEKLVENVAVATTKVTADVFQVNPIEANNNRKKKNNVAKEIDPTSVPNKDFEVGKELSKRLQSKFPPELYGRPIEDVDPFYKNDYVI